jgi:hypothetical protein
MSKTLDLTGYSLEVVGRDLRMKPNADGYAAAFTWAFLMALLLVIQWWSFGESADARRVAFNNLSAEKQAEFFQAGADAKREVELIQAQMSELQANSLRGKKVSPVVMEKIMNLNTELMKAKRKSQKFVVPELPRPRPISAMVYRSCQVLFISLALLPFAILPFIRPTVVYEGLPGEGVFVVTLLPLVWRYRQGVIGFHAITPAVKREVRFSGRGSERQFHDVGFLWMIRLTPQPVTSLEIGDHEFRIILKLMPDKGMVRDQLPMYVRTPLRFFEGVTGLIHDRILVEDTVNVNTALGTMTTRTEVIHTGSS